MPISISGILTVVIFSFTLVTQEFVYALTFISSASHQTVGVGCADLTSSGATSTTGGR